MMKRVMTFSVIGLMIGLAAQPVLAQARAQGTAPQPASAAPTTASKAPYVVPKTPWGEPDLQGMWPLNHLIATNLQRSPNYGTRRFLTDEEFAAAQKNAAASSERFQGGAIPTADARTASRLTSLISDPPDGRFPAFTPKGQEMFEKLHGSYRPRRVTRKDTAGNDVMIDIFDNIDDFDTWDRCITRGMPVSMLTRNYNVGIRVMQSPGYVIILLEMAHEARIIPTDGRPNLDPTIRQYLGESRGRWEGNTLVIETLNFNGKPAMTNSGVPGAPALNPASENMRIVERLTRTGPETVDYKMTIEDPTVLTRSWSVEFPWQLDPDYDMYEYACHEGNTAVRNYIETSRFERANPLPPAPARGGRGGAGAGAPAGGGGRGGRGGAPAPDGNQ
ncbi:MAG TPA: hypothetical protein VMB70_07300 [Terriglobia bacterium]|nr:hypothetical protein [Terriglobia bacterium]